MGIPRSLITKSDKIQKCNRRSEVYQEPFRPPSANKRTSILSAEVAIVTSRHLRIIAAVSPSIHLPTIVPVEPTSATLRHNPVDHRNTTHGRWRIGRSGGRIRSSSWGRSRSRSSRGRRRRGRDRRKIHPTNTRPSSIIVGGSRRRSRTTPTTRDSSPDWRAAGTRSSPSVPSSPP